MRKLPLAVAVLLVSAACQSAPGGPAFAAAQQRRAIFDTIWNTINTQYYDSTFHGVDWNSIRTQYRPAVDTASADAVFYGMMELMLAELQDAHTVMQHPETARGKGPGPGRDVGITLADVEGMTAITAVEPGTDAHRAGVRRGDVGIRE